VLASRTRDIALAEDALADAFERALRTWPEAGVPDSPEGWLLTVARHRQSDVLGSAARRTSDALPDDDALGTIATEVADRDPDEIPDKRLELLFACAHPAIDPAVRTPLMLQTVLGFDAGTIASAFLVAPAAMGQRLVRAKNKIRQAGIGFHVPAVAELPVRLDAVLDAVYAAYAEGWSDAEEADPRRRNLAEEAIFLGRLLVALLPQEPEALGLLALMLHAHARRAARRNPAGDYVPIADQDTSLWDVATIEEAESLLHDACALGRMGRFQLEAALQSAHSVRRTGAPVPAAAIVRLYDALLEITGSPVTALNRAVALADIEGAPAALAALDALAPDARLRDYQPYWAARAELLARCGAREQAREAYGRAIGLERDPAVRRFLQGRAASV